MLALVVVKVILAAICLYSALMLIGSPGQGDDVNCARARALRSVGLGIIALAFGFALYGGEL